MSIEVAGSLIPGTTDTPLDARTRIAALADAANIENPFVGMEFFCVATGKKYRVLALKSKTIGALEVPNAQIDSYELIPGKAEVDAKAGNAAVETLGVRVAVLEEASGASIKTLMLNKPTDGLHLIVKLAGADGTRANAATIIDTRNVAADRAKVKAYLDTGTDGSWVECPADGFPTPYDNAPVAVDLSVLTSIPAILYYAWYADASTLSDWQSTIFPVPGGAGGGGAGGLDGEPAGFGVPTASVTSLAEGAAPTVGVAASGVNTAKVFAFSFGIPKGDKGDKGDTGGSFVIQVVTELPENPDSATLYLIPEA